jgi:heat shock protein HslJ
MATHRNLPARPALLLAPVAALALALTACGGPAAPPGSEPPRPWSATSPASEPPAPDAPLTATTWTVDTLISGDTASSVPAGATGLARFTIAPDATATGSLGCNRFSARAALEGATVTFGELVTTRMACTGPAGEVERALTALFADGPLTARIQGSALTLTAADGKGLGAKASSAAE